MKISHTLSLLLLSFLLPVMLLSCQNDDLDPLQDPPAVRLDTNLSKDKNAFRQAVLEREGEDGVDFSIQDVKRENGQLRVQVQGGCNSSSFHFIWDGSIAESYPMQVRLALVHQQDDAACTEEREHHLVLDLAKLIGENARLRDYVFHVYNGSKHQDATVDTHGTTSIKNH